MLWASLRMEPQGAGGLGRHEEPAAAGGATCGSPVPDPFPAAPAVSCPALQAPAGGRKFGTKYLVEHEVHFACNPGFELLGSSTRTCQANGSWSGQEPRCTGTAAVPSPGAGWGHRHWKRFLG